MKIQIHATGMNKRFSRFTYKNLFFVGTNEPNRLVNRFHTNELKFPVFQYKSMLVMYPIFTPHF